MRRAVRLPSLRVAPTRYWLGAESHEPLQTPQRVKYVLQTVRDPLSLPHTHQSQTSDGSPDGPLDTDTHEKRTTRFRG